MGRIRTWHAGQPEPRRERHDWRTVVQDLHAAGDKAGADALDDIMRLTDVVRGRARHWADTVLHGRSSGSYTTSSHGSTETMPFAIRCALDLLDVAARLREIADDHQLHDRGRL